MPLSIHSATGQIEGKRDYQEDYAAVYDDVVLAGDSRCCLAILCDGMGGHVEGRVASRLACETFHLAFANGAGAELKSRLSASLDAANEAIAEDCRDHPARGGMGTTLVAAVVADRLLHWISVGDSPLWLRRAASLTRLNADHSLAPVLDRLVEMGELSAEQARRDGRRNQLLSALTGEELEHIDLPDESVVLEPGDDVVLASDGVEALGAGELKRLLRRGRSRRQAARVEAVLRRIADKDLPEQDNATIVLMHCKPQKPQAGSLAGRLAAALRRQPPRADSAP